MNPAGHTARTDTAAALTGPSLPEGNANGGCLLSRPHARSSEPAGPQTYLGAAGGEDDVPRAAADHPRQALPGCADDVLGLPTCSGQNGDSSAWLYQEKQRNREVTRTQERVSSSHTRRVPETRERAATWKGPSAGALEALANRGPRWDWGGWHAPDTNSGDAWEL